MFLSWAQYIMPDDRGPSGFVVLWPVAGSAVPRVVARMGAWGKEKAEDLGDGRRHVLPKRGGLCGGVSHPPIEGACVLSWLTGGIPAMPMGVSGHEPGFHASR